MSIARLSDVRTALVTLLVCACGERVAQRPDLATRESAAAPPSVAASPRRDAVALDSAVRAVHESADSVEVAAAAAERAALVDMPQWTRQPGVLTLRAASGRELRFVDDGREGASYQRHRLVGRLGATDYATVHRAGYEGGDVIVVSLRTADTTVVPAEPVASPDGRRAVVASMDFEAGYVPNGLIVLALTDSGPRREFEQTTADDRFAGWAPSHPRWLDARTVELTRNVLVDPATMRVDTSRVRLVLDAGRWTIRPAAP